MDLKKPCSPSILPVYSLSLSVCLFLYFSPFFHFFALFPIPSLLLDIWANNQSHFIPVREQMEFQLRVWQQKENKGFSETHPAFALFCCKDPSLQQVFLTFSENTQGWSWMKGHTDLFTISRMLRCTWSLCGEKCLGWMEKVLTALATFNLLVC